MYLVLGHRIHQISQSVARVVSVAERCAAEDVFEIALADTIGVGAPSDVRERFRAVRSALPPRIQLRAHFHNTRNTALANAVAAVEEGVRVLDGSLGGIGGCPFAPGAAGNVPTEVVAPDRPATSGDIDMAERFFSRSAWRSPSGMPLAVLGGMFVAGIGVAGLMLRRRDLTGR